MICGRCGSHFSYRKKGWKKENGSVRCPKCAGYKRQARLTDYKRRQPKSRITPSWTDLYHAPKLGTFRKKLSKEEARILRKIHVLQKSSGMVRVSKAFGITAISLTKSDVQLIPKKSEREAVSSLLRKGILFQPRPDYLKVT